MARSGIRGTSLNARAVSWECLSVRLLKSPFSHPVFASGLAKTSLLQGTVRLPQARRSRAQRGDRLSQGGRGSRLILAGDNTNNEDQTLGDVLPS